MARQGFAGRCYTRHVDPQEASFGRAALELGLLTLDQLLDVTAERGRRGDVSLPRLLVEVGILDEQQAEDVARLVTDRPEVAGLLGPRYEVGTLLGKGANGSVWMAGDRRLGRKVALKLHSKGADLTPIELVRFCHEAQVTGQLAHPSIVPVHDLGLLPDGRPYYTMKRIGGATLKEVLDRLKRDDGEFEQTWTLTHFVSVLLRVAQALAFAHDSGVVHRDVKPANIMVGDYGEVLLLDWGVARVLESPPPTAERVATWRSEGDTDRTLAGTIAGTPAYMAPEQARGDIEGIGPATDVYSVGVVLYEYLCKRRPFVASSVRDLLNKVVSDPIAPPSLIEGARRVPEDFEDLVMRCIDKDPAKRFADGGELAAAMEAWLEGSQRREEAIQLSLRGSLKSTAYIRASEAAAGSERAVREREQELPPWASSEQRRAVWQEESRFGELRKLRDDTYDDAIALFQAALEREPQLDDARAGLASLYLRKMDEAETRGERGAVRFFRSQVLRYDPRILGRLLQGEASLDLDTDPPGAAVSLHQVRRRERVFEVGLGDELGTTPLRGVPIPPGSWVLRVDRPGHLPLTAAIAPGRPDQLKLRLRLPRAEDIQPGFVVIPAGAAILGGDPRAVDGEDRRIADLPDFAMGEHPVTVGEFGAFLADGGKEAGHTCWTGPDSVPVEDRPRLPALGIGFESAQAYARWLSDRSGRSFRLPSHDEWEKAARGADGRPFPWGPSWEPTFCNNPDAEPGEPAPRPVGSFPRDRSVYGVEDLAGGVNEWVLGAVPHRPDRGWMRGGSWNGHRQQSRLCSRLSGPRRTRGGTVGFRLVQEL